MSISFSYERIMKENEPISTYSDASCHFFTKKQIMNLKDEKISNKKFQKIDKNDELLTKSRISLSFLKPK